MQIKHQFKKLEIYGIAFIIPVIVLIFSFFFKAATGPYWQFPDPSYGYLSSSLSLLKGFSPTFNYQPGTTVEILGGVVILLLNFGHSVPDIVHKVLLTPDFYLSAINTFMVLFSFLTSSLLGFYVYRQTHDKLACLLSQLPTLSFLALRSYSFYDYVLPVVSNVSPEPLMISVSILFNLFFLKLFFARKQQDEIGMAILLGFICGLGIASRLTFGPIVLLPFIVCRGWLKLLFLAVAMVSTFLWTIPIIPHYPWIWKWVVMLMTHTGAYGSGSQGFIDLHQYLLFWQTILNKCGLLILFGCVAVFFSLGQVISKHSSRGNIFLLATAFCLCLQLALVAKHYDDHYLVSPINLFAPLFVLSYLNFKNKKFFPKAVFILGIMVFMVQSLGHAWAYRQELSGYTKDAVSFNDRIHSKYPHFTFIGVYPMPMATREAAIFWGNDRDNRQQDELSAMYPGNLAYFDNNTNDYAPYVSGIYNIKERIWADDLISSGAHVLFVAPKTYDFSQTPYTVMPLEQGKFAAAFLLVQSTEKEAEELFDASIKFFDAGDFPHAFIFALKSRELHYQPAGKVLFLLSLIYPHIKH